MTDFREVIMAMLKKLGEELEFEDLFLQRGELSDYSRQLTSAMVALDDNRFSMWKRITINFASEIINVTNTSPLDNKYRSTKEICINYIIITLIS